MHWRKMKIHLKHWANSLEEEGYHADAKYVREELITIYQFTMNEVSKRYLS